MSLYEAAKGKPKYHQRFIPHKCCNQKTAGMWLEKRKRKDKGALLNTVGCAEDP